MSYPKATGFKRILNASRFSIAGFKAAWHYEAAFRQEIILLTLTTPLACWLGSTVFDKLMLIGSLLLVVLIELLNSAIEAAIDRIGLEHHALSARAKDLGSAAVMLSLFWAMTVWISYLLTR
jgi:diacylglycerol kinase (ATP)